MSTQIVGINAFFAVLFGVLVLLSLIHRRAGYMGDATYYIAWAILVVVVAELF